MSITEKVRELIADSHATGYASELPDAVTRVLHAIAEHVEGIAPAALPAGDLEAKVKSFVDGALGNVSEKLKPFAEAAVAQVRERFATLEQAFAGQLKDGLDAIAKELQGGIEAKVSQLFTELLAKAAQSETAKSDAPAAPQPEATAQG